MERLGPDFERVMGVLRQSRIGKLVSMLQARISQGEVVDSLAKHETSARRRNDPALYDRVKALRKKEREGHRDHWAF